MFDGDVMAIPRSSVRYLGTANEKIFMEPTWYKGLVDNVLGHLTLHSL